MRILGLAAGLGLVLGVSAFAGGDHGPGGHSHGHGHGHSHGPPPEYQAFARHGGAVMKDGGHHFEAVFSDEGIRLHPMNGLGEPSPPDGMRARVLLKARRGRRISLKLKPVIGQGFLECRKNLRSVKDGSRTAIFTVQGLGRDGKGKASMWTRFERRPGHSH